MFNIFGEKAKEYVEDKVKSFSKIDDLPVFGILCYGALIRSSERNSWNDRF